MSETAIPRVFGIIPAAGASKRMGRPKQLLPVGQSTMLNTVIESVLSGGLDGLVVVTNHAVNEALKLTEDRRFHTAILADPEAEMLESVLLGMNTLTSHYRPGDAEAFMVCPGDIAGVTGQLVARCADEYRSHPGRIIVAAIGDKMGHPIVIPADLHGDVERLRGVGLKQILSKHEALVRRVEADAPKQMTDVDTPKDYEALR